MYGVRRVARWRGFRLRQKRTPEEDTAALLVDAVRAKLSLRRSYHGNKDVTLPEYTVGACRIARSCLQYYTDLADGLCVEHWDSGYYSHPPSSNVVE